MSDFADFPTVDHGAALAAAASGAVVVTANKRLARRLHADFGQRIAAGGRTVWERPEILPWEVWLAHQLQALDDPPVLLQTAQTMHLWRRVVDEWAAGQGERGVLLQRSGCARQAADAWRLMHEFEAPWPALDGVQSFETTAFRDLATAYRRHLAARSALDSALLPIWLGERLPAGIWHPPARLILAGFLDLTPAAERLCAALAAAGCRLERLALPAAPNCRGVRCGYDDSEAEIRGAADFARRRLLADPAARIAIVALDLDGRRAALERVFSEVLAPESLLAAEPDSIRSFEITLGTPLAGEPPVFDALLALELAAGPAGFGTVSRLLRSPFIAADPEAPLLEAALRDDNPGRLCAAELAAIAERRRPQAGILATALRGFITKLESGGGRATPPAWSKRFNAALAALGWPGGRRLSSREYQALEAFDEALETLAALGAVARHWTLGEALAELRLLLGEQIFHTATPPTPVLITEPLQALGLSFDHLWWLGLKAGDWPPPARPNPFLPYAVQMRSKMPRASAAGELDRAASLTAALFAAAPERVASWPKNAGDEPLQPSPLLTGLDEHPPAPPAGDYRSEMRASGALEAYDAGPAPALPAGRRQGGARLLEDQSACPFKAFAVHRLRAAPLPEVVTGLNAMQRGNLAHRCLQVFYEAADGRLPPAAECGALIDKAVEAALAAGSRILALADPRLAAVERRRLGNLLADWIEIDRARPVPFEVVAMEEKRQITIGPLTLSVRVDRIDRLEQPHISGANRVLIDYKSGEKKPGAWRGERPEEPQLPLYALEEGDALAAVCYANLKPGAMGYQGIARDPGQVPGTRALEKSPLKAQAADFAALLAGWRRTLGALAEEHAAGVAAVRPRDTQVCRYCGLEALCRIDERRGPGGELVAEAGDDDHGEDDTP